MSKTYVENMLGNNEEIQLVTRQHSFVLTSAIVFEIFVILVILVGGTIATISFPMAGFTFLLAIFPLLSMTHDILAWYNRQYIITNRRVIQMYGVINKEVIDSSLEKVNDVKLTQSFFGRIFNYGNVEIMTASDMGVNVFKRIGNPIQFKTAMLNAKEKMHFEDGETHPTTAKSIPTLITELDELRKKGVVTEAEFQQKKAELLSRM